MSSMSSTAPAKSALRSYLPERTLINRRDVAALAHKYRERAFPTPLGAARIWLNPASWFEQTDSTDMRFRAEKRIGGLRVQADGLFPAIAHDTQTGQRLSIGDPDVTLLHVDSFRGVQDMRTRLAQAAAYIKANEKLRNNGIVAGITYRELGAAAVAFGLREMRTEEVAASYERSLIATHAAYCAVNGRDNPFEATVVYLPTPEFIDRFSAHAVPMLQNA